MCSHLCNASCDGTKTPIESLTFVPGSIALSKLLPNLSVFLRLLSLSQTFGRTSDPKHLNSSFQT